MAQDLICRPILCRYSIFNFFFNWRYLKKNYLMNFNGRRTKLLKMYSSMAGRVENIKKKFFNNFKMLKTTFNCLILIIFVTFCDF